jgi:hypothetical protein
LAALFDVAVFFAAAFSVTAALAARPGLAGGFGFAAGVAFTGAAVFAAAVLFAVFCTAGALSAGFEACGPGTSGRLRDGRARRTSAATVSSRG